MHWNKFANAMRDIAAQPFPEAQGAKTMVLNALELAQRFYLPNGSDVLEGKIIDAQLQKFMHLPYPIIAVLHESFIGEKENHAWLITLATESRTDHGFNMISLILSKSRPNWVVTPVMASVTLTPPAGYHLAVSGIPGDTGDAKLFANLIEPKEFSDDAWAVFNLCALLGTVAKTERVAAPERLNKARVRNGKTPLPDYHVLNVGGEKWDTPHTSGGGHGHGVRSHLRRGHIRHLNDERWVWVRSTIVVGSREGFANKEYKVNE